jgi:hypothetical protein
VKENNQNRTGASVGRLLLNLATIHWWCARTTGMRAVPFICILLASCADKAPLLMCERKVTFSSSSDPDLFTLVGRGNDTLSASMTFSVISRQGDTLWKDTFPSTDLIGYGLIDTDEHTVTSGERMAYIGQRVSHFFDDVEFSIPAIPENETDDPISPGNAIWKDIRLDTKAVGFHYLIGEENNRCIAYAKTKKVVVEYRSFD